MPLKEGDIVHLIDRKGKKYQIMLKKGGSFFFHRGSVSHDDIIGLEEGSIVKSTRGEPLFVWRPTLSDFILKMRRGAQVIYPKDIGAILMLADIFPGARVLEAGTGSGALTLALLRAVGENGIVFSYENRSDFLEIAKQNIQTFFKHAAAGNEEGIGKLVLRQQDIYEGIAERNLDRIILDLSTPWRALPHVKASLRSGGILLCYLPTVLQVFKLAKRISKIGGFSITGIHEVLMREWEISGISIRPAHRMVAHTGFIFVARRLAEEEN